MMFAIEVANLSKRYRSVQVLDGLDLKVNMGEVYGLLGQNGAGKSTLVHLLLGFIFPDSGSIQVLGKKPEAARTRIGYLPEHMRYHTNFTAREYLHDLGSLSDLSGKKLASRCEYVLHLVGLSSAANRGLGGYSKGMLQRLGVAQALIHEPDLLLIDEPTSGLDPAGQREMIDLVKELRSQGHTIFMCTHQIAEAEDLCDRVGILSGRRLSAETIVSELRSSGGVVILPRNGALPEPVSSHLLALAPRVIIAGNEIRVANDEMLQRQVLSVLLDAEVPIAEMRPLAGGLEEMYLRVVRGKVPWEYRSATETEQGNQSLPKNGKDG